MDEGVFSPGNGTYEIRDFTLLLRSANEQPKQLAFSGLLGADAAVKNEIIFLGRAEFNKRR